MKLRDAVIAVTVGVLPFLFENFVLLNRAEDNIMLKVTTCKENVCTDDCTTVTEKHHFALCVGD